MSVVTSPGGGRGRRSDRVPDLLPPGFLLDKKIGVNQPKRMENVKILIANTGMDTDKIKVGARLTSRPPGSRWRRHGGAVLEPVSCLVSDLRLQGARGLDREGGGDRAGREGEDEGEGGSNPQTRNQLLHQQVRTHVHAHARHQQGAPSCFILLLLLHRQLIYNYPEQLFAQAGIMAIEHADFSGVERLALVTGTCTHTCTHMILV